MNKPATEMLGLAAAVVMMIVLIAVAIILFTDSSGTVKGAQEDISSNTRELEEQKYIMYENTNVSGSQVINAIRKFKSKQGEIGINVVTGKSNKWYVSTFNKEADTMSTGSVDYGNAVDNLHSEYINPSATFKSTVARDKNGVIRSITFTQL